MSRQSTLQEDADIAGTSALRSSRSASSRARGTYWNTRLRIRNGKVVDLTTKSGKRNHADKSASGINTRPFTLSLSYEGRGTCDSARERQFAMTRFTEDTSSSKPPPTICVMSRWESVYAYNDETFGPEGTLGRRNDREVGADRYLGEALVKLNPGLPQEAYRDAIRQITDYSLHSRPCRSIQEKYDLLKDGLQGAVSQQQRRVVQTPPACLRLRRAGQQSFPDVRELWVRGVLYRRRADLVGFVNGIPLLFMELKNVNRDIRAAYGRNLADYKDTVPHLFHHDAVPSVTWCECEWTGRRGPAGGIHSNAQIR